MGLEYDFDIVAIASIDTETQSAPSQPRRALFRDVKTADALRAASPKIRKIFLDAGFGLETHRGKLPSGYYGADDAGDRDRIIRRLFANIKSMGVQGEYCGEFDFMEFLHSIRTVQPLAGAAGKPPLRLHAPDQPKPAQPARRTVPGRVGFALGLAVILFVLLKFLAAAGATP